MKRIILLFFVLLSLRLSAQEPDSAFSIDLLKAPQSPGFTILNVSPSQIDRPSNPTDFAVSIANASDNFASLPKNYAVEFSPAWIFGKKKITSDQYKSSKTKDVIWQNIVFSLATATNKTDGSDSNTTKLGFGVKFTLARGKLDPSFEKTVNAIQQNLDAVSMNKHIAKAALQVLKDSLNVMDTKARHAANNSDEKKSLEFSRDSLHNVILKIDGIIDDSVNDKSSELRKIKQLALTLDDKRYGFKADIAAALAIDFPTAKLDTHVVRKYSVWATAGYDWKKGFGFFAVTRFSSLPNQMYRNTTGDTTSFHTANEYYLDCGIKVSYDMVKHLSLSMEGIARAAKTDTSNMKFRYRYTFNASYEFLPNKMLTFYIGKDFAGGVKTKGNLITALNFVLGFGSKRPVVSKSKSNK